MSDQEMLVQTLARGSGGFLGTGTPEESDCDRTVLTTDFDRYMYTGHPERPLPRPYIRPSQFIEIWR